MENKSEKWEIKEVDRYVILNKPIGKGNQAVVYEAYCKDTMEPIAAKVFDLKELTKFGLQKYIVRQIKFQDSIKHPYIVNVISIKQTAHNVYFFLEYCDGGNLESYLHQHNFLSEAECVDLLRQIVDAFLLLKKNKIAHRDLKPANILLNKGQLKIADFGLAKRMDEDPLNTYVGSPIFMCPQALEKTGIYDLEKGDIWSAGVCLYLMLYRQYPFISYKNEEDLLQVVRNKPLTFPQSSNQPRSSAIMELLQKMLDKNEETRFNWDDVSNHRCIKGSTEYFENPVLGSIELNQIHGVSGFNNKLKNVEMQRIEASTHSGSGSSSGGTVNSSEVRQTIQEQFGLPICKDNLREIHAFVKLQSQFALLYRLIWKGFFQLLNMRSQMKQLQGEQFQQGVLEESNINNGIILLMCGLLGKEQLYFSKLIEQTASVVKQRLVRHGREGRMSEDDLSRYLSSGDFIAFHGNLGDSYMDTQVSITKAMPLFKAHLNNINYSINDNCSEEEWDQHIARALSIINQRIEQLAIDLQSYQNKSVLILVLYLSFLQKNEARLQRFIDPFEHFSKLIQYLERINFMDPSDIFKTICEYVKQDQNSDD